MVSSTRVNQLIPVTHWWIAYNLAYSRNSIINSNVVRESAAAAYSCYSMVSSTRVNQLIPITHWWIAYKLAYSRKSIINSKVVRESAAAAYSCNSLQIGFVSDSPANYGNKLISCATLGFVRVTGIRAYSHNFLRNITLDPVAQGKRLLSLCLWC